MSKCAQAFNQTDETNRIDEKDEMDPTTQQPNRPRPNR